MNTVLAFLHRNRERLNLERYGVPAQLSSVMVTPRFRASNHVVFLVLPQGKPEPVLVAKVPRLAGANGSVEREVANLQTVQASRAGGFDSIPRVIAFEKYGNRSILIETALVGRPMDPPNVRRNFAGCCQAVVDWLTEVQQPVDGPGETDDSWFKQLVEYPLHYFRDVFPLSIEEERLLERTWRLIEPLRDINLPLVVEHGDLSHPNVMLLKDGGPGVVDWELANLHGLPTCDLFFFLTYVAFARHNARKTGNYLPAFHAAFFGRRAWAGPYIHTYAERLNLSRQVLVPLFVLTWARYMVSLLQRLDNAGDVNRRTEPETATWLRANRYYQLWRHTVTHVNELEWHDLSRMTQEFFATDTKRTD